MFWRMTGLSTVSPVDTILDQGNFTLEELLDEDEMIQECRGLNNRLINFLRERTQVEQLLRYIVEEAPEDAEKGRTFKYPFVASEIFTCEVDIILKTLVEDEELMNLLFSFLEPQHPHSTLLSGYFSKVVACLLLRKSAPLINYIQAHPDIIQKLVDLVGITSIMEVLIRLFGADENLYTSFADSTKWLEDIDVLKMIVDKFSSSDCPQVHGNAAETLCAIIRYGPPGLAAKISSPSFIGRLFDHALVESRPKSVLVNGLCVCICLLDPNRQTSGANYIYNRQFTPHVTTNPEIVDAMLDSLGNLSKLLDVSIDENILPTTYGKLQPPLGKHRLKIVEFISVLMSIKSETAEKELIRLGVLKSILKLFFEYEYNNFLHHHAEQIIVSSLESKNPSLVQHILDDCNLVTNIIHSETNTHKDTATTVCSEGRVPPRIGNVGHMTRIANKLIQLMTDNNYIQSHLQGNSEWVEWHANVLEGRNALENVLQWACGRPTPLHDPGRDSDDDDYHDKDYDVAALTNNLSQAFGYGFYENADSNQAHGSLEGDDEDVYFDDEAAEVVISSLQLGDNQQSGSLITNSDWFAEPSTDTAASPPPNTAAVPGGNEGVKPPENDDDLSHTATSSTNNSTPSETDKQPEQVDRKDSGEPGGTTTDPAGTSPLNSEPEPPKVEETDRGDEREASSSSTTDQVAAEGGGPGGGPPPHVETHTDGEEKK